MDEPTWNGLMRNVCRGNICSLSDSRSRRQLSKKDWIWNMQWLIQIGARKLNMIWANLNIRGNQFLQLFLRLQYQQSISIVASTCTGWLTHPGMVVAVCRVDLKWLALLVEKASNNCWVKWWVIRTNMYVTMNVCMYACNQNEITTKATYSLPG